MPYEDTDWTTADDTAKDTAKRFFADSAGAHVTSADSDATTGANALLDNSDLHFRDGTTDVARFGANGSQLGKDNEAHLVMDANSMELYDENGVQLFFAGDMRDVETGKMRINQTVLGDAVTAVWTMRHPSDGIVSVELNGTTLTEGTDYTATLLPGFTNWTVSFPTAPAVGDMIVFTYDVTTPVLAFSMGGVATGDRSVAESSGHAEGSSSHAEGSATARGEYSHAEGSGGTADADKSHVEGIRTNAYGEAAHAEGNQTYANGDYSHAEGDNTTAAAIASHAEGLYTFAGSAIQHVGGKYNVTDTNREYAEIIGNGSDTNARSNARTLDWSGNEELQGELYLGGCTANGETPYPAPRYNTLTSNLEYWDGTAWQNIPIASTGPKVYAGSVVKTASGTNCQLWTKAAFESTFHTTNAQMCGVSITNGEAAVLDGPVVSAEYWSSGSNPGWFARWTGSGSSGTKRFNYIVAVPSAYSTV